MEALNFTHLSQIYSQTDAFSLLDGWLDSGSLSLEGSLATEWNRYTTALKGAGISLSDTPDILLWAGGDATGSITVKNLYEAYLQQMRLDVDNSWIRLIWKWQVPLKLKLFIWLAARGKILSWEALRHRGWEGPGICPLCSLASDDVHHLLVHCTFTQEVWHLLRSLSPSQWSRMDPLSPLALLTGSHTNQPPHLWLYTFAGSYGQRGTKPFLKTVLHPFRR
jgi:hypothetical protein